MKRLLYIFLIPVITFALNLDQEIEMLKKLPPQEKYILLNKIKKQLINLNEKERMKILKKLFKLKTKNEQPNIDENSIIENQTSEGGK